MDVAYLWLSDWTRLQWSLRSLIFGVRRSNLFEVGTKVEIHNNSLLGEGKIESFCLDLGRIIGNFHFYIVPVGTSGVNIELGAGMFLFWGEGNWTAQCNV